MPPRSMSSASPRSVASAAGKPATTRRVLAYAAIYLLWGGSFLGIRDVVAVTPPFFAAGFRFVIAGGALYLMARMSGARPPSRRQLWHSFGMGVVMFGGN